MYAKDLKVNDKLAIVRYGNRGVVSSQGVYTVVKADKMKVVMKRDGDGYERIWSVKKDCELGEHGYHSASLITVRDLAECEANRIIKVAKANLYRDIETAAKNNNLEAIEKAVAELKHLLGA
jgi:methionine aminopeptidase